MKEQQKTLFNICIWFSIIAFLLRCAIAWYKCNFDISLYSLFGYASEAVGLASLFIVAYEKWIWRYNPFEKTPKLSKTYKGILKSSYDNKERNATLIIKQSLLFVHVTLITDESKSKSLFASIDNILGEQQLAYCYLNTPKSKVRNRSEIHYGTAVLSISDTTLLEGQYYTDRKTIGDMEFHPN